MTETNELMTWENNVRKVGGSIYIAIPHDFVRSKGIQRDYIAVYSLQADGSLKLSFRKPRYTLDGDPDE